jgi:hypothetical protein
MTARAAGGRRGVALITVLGIIVIVAVLVLGSILTTEIEVAVSRNDLTATQAQYLAQAGLQSAKARLFQTFRYVISEDGVVDPCVSQFDQEIDFSRDGSGQSWGEDNTISLGTEAVFSADGELVGFFTVDLLRDPTRRNVITVRSLGERTRDPNNVSNPLAVSRASATFSISTGSGLEQAIYAGAGSGMFLVNGNAEVYGGVYIEGDRAAYEADGSQSVVFSSNGTFRQLNGYDSSVLQTGNYNPADFLLVTSVGNLCASFRVAYGAIEVDGSTELGKPDNKLYSVAVGQDGANVTYNGEPIEGDVDDTCRRNLGVCSQAGVTGFDLLEAPRFPRFDEAPANAELCNNVATWRECLRNEALDAGLVIAFADGELTGDAGDLDEACASILTSAYGGSDRTLALGTEDVDCTVVIDGVPRGFTYSYASGRGVFEAYGHLNFRGLNVTFEAPTEYSVVGGTGNAGLTLESDPPGTATGGGNLRIESDFVPLSPNRYPEQVLTLVAEHMLTLNGGNRTTVTAPVYAGDLFRIRANSTLLGQVIADAFCSMGNPNTDDCGIAGTPPRIVFSSAGENRPASYRAVASPGGTPTFALLGYEQR